MGWEMLKTLKKMKEERDLTYQQIADRSGVPLSTVHRVVEGQAKNPGYETMTAIREVLEGGAEASQQPDSQSEQAKVECHACPRDMPTRQEYAQMSAAYQELLRRAEDTFRTALENKEAQFAAERANYSRWIRALAIAFGVMVLFVMLLLIIDITNPNVGWVRAAFRNGASNALRFIVSRLAPSA